MIRAEALSKNFGNFKALRDVTFEVGEGEIFGLLGPNGAGKTTTVRILASLLKPTNGQASVAGHDVVSAPAEVRRRIGLLTEVPGLYERLSAREYLDFFGNVYDVPSSTRRSRIEELLRMLGIWDRRDYRLSGFSKGMKQKIAIARTLIHSPAVLFFDEPTAALDPESAKMVRDYLLDLIKSERRTILLCTHNLHEAERLCDRVGVIRQGTLIVQGRPRELLGAEARFTVLRLRDSRTEHLLAIQGIEGVASVRSSDSTISFEVREPEVVNPEVVRRIVALGGEIVSMSVEAKPLEDAYIELMKGLDA